MRSIRTRMKLAKEFKTFPKSIEEAWGRLSEAETTYARYLMERYKYDEAVAIETAFVRGWDSQPYDYNREKPIPIMETRARETFGFVEEAERASERKTAALEETGEEITCESVGTSKGGEVIWKRLESPRECYIVVEESFSAYEPQFVTDEIGDLYDTYLNDEGVRVTEPYRFPVPTPQEAQQEQQA